MNEPRVAIDHDADAAYIELNNNTIVETKRLTSSIQIDIDQFGNVVGIELLTLDLRTSER